MCEHEFKPLKIEKDGKKVQACQECGALKIGENTIIVDTDYIELAPLTADPTLAEGRVWFRSDEGKTKWSPDGTIIEELGTALLPDLASIRGFVYLAEGTPTDSWNFTTNPSKDVWIKQYSTNACFQSKYNFYGSYAHWTADNTFVDVPNKADNVYGDGEVLATHTIPTGKIMKAWKSPGNYSAQGPQDMTFDGQYYWVSRGEAGHAYLVYAFNEDGVLKDQLQTNIPTCAIEWDGQYLWKASCAKDWIYQIKKDTGEIVHAHTQVSQNAQGLAWDGEYLWESDGGSETVYKTTPAGTQKGAWNTPHDLEGAGWDGLYLWLGSNTGGLGSPPGHVYRYKPDGTQVGHIQIPCPGGIEEAATWDGKYLWVNDEGSGWVYAISGDTFDLSYKVSPA